MSTMTPFKYQIVVQWSSKNSRYEAYSPTLMLFAAKFEPSFPKAAYGDTLPAAIENSVVQSTNLLKRLKNLAILPPPSDVGETDLDYEVESLGEMVL